MQSNQRMSQAVAHGDTIYLAGQIAADVDGIGAQTQAVLDKIDALLVANGSDKSKILTATIWLVNMDDFAAMNMVWDAWVDPTNTPARAAVGSPLANPAALVEIMVTAAR